MASIFEELKNIRDVKTVKTGQPSENVDEKVEKKESQFSDGWGFGVFGSTPDDPISKGWDKNILLSSTEDSPLKTELTERIKRIKRNSVAE